MNPEVKQKWVDALRSGEYKQGKSRLRRVKDGYAPRRKRDSYWCCLGVLTDLYSKEFNNGQGWKWDKVGAFWYWKTSHKDYLSDEVMEWAELNYDDPVVSIKSYAEGRSLATINDGGFSFDKIAAFIEESL